MCLAASVIATSALKAQEPPRHPLHAGVLSPGAIGGQRLLRGGPLSGYTQPVELRVPEGVHVGMASDGQFTTPEIDNPVVGLTVGYVYRFRLTNLFDRPGVEVYPSVEVIDRLYPPPGAALKFPVPVDITARRSRTRCKWSIRDARDLRRRPQPGTAGRADRGRDALVRGGGRRRPAGSGRPRRSPDRHPTTWRSRLVASRRARIRDLRLPSAGRLWPQSQWRMTFLVLSVSHRHHRHPSSKQRLPSCNPRPLRRCFRIGFAHW